MKPYRETHTLEGVLDAPIETVWALHTNPEEMQSVFARILETEIVAGRPGEVGCLTRSAMRTSKGQLGTVEGEIVAVQPPHNLSVRSIVLEYPRVTYETTRTFARQGNRTQTTVIITTRTSPVPGPVRFLLGLRRAKRAREGAIDFKRELAEENAFHARSMP